MMSDISSIYCYLISCKSWEPEEIITSIIYFANTTAEESAKEERHCDQTLSNTIEEGVSQYRYFLGRYSSELEENVLNIPSFTKTITQTYAGTNFPETIMKKDISFNISYNFYLLTCQNTYETDEQSSIRSL